MMLGGVKTKDVLSLTGARIDCAQVFAPLHFPDGSYDSIFFNCVISNLFSVCFRRGFICGGSRALAYCGFVFRHANSTTPIYRGRFFWVPRIVAYDVTSVQPSPPKDWFSLRGDVLSSAFRLPFF